MRRRIGVANSLGPIIVAVGSWLALGPSIFPSRKRNSRSKRMKKEGGTGFPENPVERENVSSSVHITWNDCAPTSDFLAVALSSQGLVRGSLTWEKYGNGEQMMHVVVVALGYGTRMIKPAPYWSLFVFLYKKSEVFRVLCKVKGCMWVFDISRP